MALFAEQGYAKATVRAIAARAEVSPALVIHHFGSKEQLRQVVDRWVLDRLLQDKAQYLPGGPMPHYDDYLAAHSTQVTLIRDYLMRCLRDGGDLASEVFDLMLELNETVTDHAVAAGVMRDPADRLATSVIMVAMTAGAHLMAEQVGRALGGGTLLDTPVLERFTLALLDLFSDPLFTDSDYLAALRASLTPHPHQDPS